LGIVVELIERQRHQIAQALGGMQQGVFGFDPLRGRTPAFLQNLSQTLDLAIDFARGDNRRHRLTFFRGDRGLRPRFSHYSVPSPSSSD